MLIEIIRKFELSLKYEHLLLKLLIIKDIRISRKAMDGADGKKNKPVLKIFTSLLNID